MDFTSETQLLSKYITCAPQGIRVYLCYVQRGVSRPRERNTSRIPPLFSSFNRESARRVVTNNETTAPQSSQRQDNAVSARGRSGSGNMARLPLPSPSHHAYARLFCVPRDNKTGKDKKGKSMLAGSRAYAMIKREIETRESRADARGCSR